MNIKDRILQLMKERGWTMYRLAKETGLPTSTLSNMIKRSTTPTMSTVKTLCDGFGISLSQFFWDGTEAVLLTEEQKLFFADWASLTVTQKDIITKIIVEFKKI